jgi:uncharacterized protein (UPF0264 family)
MAFLRTMQHESRISVEALSVQHTGARQPQLLVSVRSPLEAEAALEGGAMLIDVKEPGHGPLGRANEGTITSILHQVAGRRRVSAAMGELREMSAPCSTRGLAFVKWGLAACGGWSRWRAELAGAIRRTAEVDPLCRVVPVVYADWRRAQAPPPEAVVAFAREHHCAALLVDTYGKDRTTLLDWLSVAEVCEFCRSAEVPVALAGSLGAKEITALRVAEPNWFAVRGAVCRGGLRTSGVDPDLVRHLGAILAADFAPAGLSGG